MDSKKQDLNTTELDDHFHNQDISLDKSVDYFGGDLLNEYGDSNEFKEAVVAKNMKKRKRKLKSEKCKYLLIRFISIIALVFCILLGLFLITDLILVYSWNEYTEKPIDDLSRVLFN